MDGGSGAVKLTDEIYSEGTHDIRFFFHVAENCSVRADGSSKIRIDTGASIVVFDADPALAVTLLVGCEHPIAGWVSRGYHRRSPATTIIAAGKSTGNARFRFTVQTMRVNRKK